MSAEILENLKKATTEYDSERAASLAKEAVQEKIDPVEALDAMTEAMRQIGEGFGKRELWLPDLVGAADAMTAATPIIKEEIKRVGAREDLARILEEARKYYKERGLISDEEMATYRESMKSANYPYE